MHSGDIKQLQSQIRRASSLIDLAYYHSLNGMGPENTKMSNETLVKAINTITAALHEAQRAIS